MDSASGQQSQDRTVGTQHFCIPCEQPFYRWSWSKAHPPLYLPATDKTKIASQYIHIYVKTFPNIFLVIVIYYS